MSSLFKQMYCSLDYLLFVFFLKNIMTAITLRDEKKELFCSKQRPYRNVLLLPERLFSTHFER